MESEKLLIEILDRLRRVEAYIDEEQKKIWRKRRQGPGIKGRVLDWVNKFEGGEIPIKMLAERLQLSSVTANNIVNELVRDTFIVRVNETTIRGVTENDC